MSSKSIQPITHPIALLARTDSDLCSLYHSFFFLSISPDLSDAIVERRIPATRARINDLESGLRMSLLGQVSKDMKDEICSSFMVTVSDGSRFYCVWRGFRDRVFVAVSKLPILHFTRDIFEALQSECPENLVNLLLALTEIPILPTSGIRYGVKFAPNRLVSFDVSSFEQVRDPDLDTLVRSVLTPAMIVAIWEALILEKKVIITSSFPNLVAPCCEFVRRLVLPMVVVSTFIPIVHESAVEILESPVPYIVGIDKDILTRNTHLQYQESVVVDLDTVKVYIKGEEPANLRASGCAVVGISKPGQGAPTDLIDRLVSDVMKIINIPLSTWTNRPCGSSKSQAGLHNTFGYKHLDNQKHPLLPQNISATIEAIIELFMETNLNLISARSCHVRAFFRRPDAYGLSTYTHRMTSQRSVSSMGFDRRDGIICGCMQLLRERKDDEMLHFLPCWVEIDGISLIVYEHADDLPLLQIPAKSVKSVSPSAMEPEGLVFELEVKNQSSFRFATTGGESRRAWIEIIEDMARRAMSTSSFSAVDDYLQSQKLFCDRGSSPSLDDDTQGGSVDLNAQQQSDVFNQAVLTDFRFKVMQTQMVAYLKARVECDEYQPVLSEIRPQLKEVHQLVNGAKFEKHMKKFLWTGNTVCSILAQSVAGELDEDEDDDEFEVPNNTRASEIDDAGGSAKEEEKKLGTPIPTQFRPQSLNVGSDGGSSMNARLSTPVASSPAAVTQCSSSKKLGFFSMFQRSSITSNSESGLMRMRSSSASAASLQIKHLEDSVKDLQVEKEREAEEARKSALRNLLHQVASSYRRCEAELSKCLVEDRLEATNKLVSCGNDEDTLRHLNLRSVGAPEVYADDTFMYADKDNCIVIDLSRILRELPRSEMAVRAHARTDELASSSIYWYVSAWRAVVRLPHASTVVDKDEIFEVGLERYFYGSLLKPVRRGSHGNHQEAALSDPSSRGAPSPTLDSPQSEEHKDSIDYNEESSTEVKKRRDIECESTLSLIRSISLQCYQDLINFIQLKDHIHHLLPVVQALLGYLLYRMDNYEDAIKAFSVGNFVSCRRIMFCTGLKFCELFLDEPRIRANRSASEFMSLLEDSASKDEPSSPVLSGGPVDNQEPQSPVASNASFGLAGKPKAEMNRVRAYLKWAMGHGQIIGLQAYRLLMELMHKRVAERLADAVLDEEIGLRKKKKLALYFPRAQSGFTGNVLASMGIGIGEGSINGQNAVVTEDMTLRQELASGALSKARGGLGVEYSDFSYATPSKELKTDVLNESVICVSSTVNACELSISLLTKLREIVRSACEKVGSDREQFQLKNLNASSWFQMHVEPALLETIVNSSAYRSFEVQSSQLQKVDLNILSESEKLLFFVNTYNVATIHALIVRGVPWKNLYERTSFLRNSKYNIGGFVFNLVEIEHGILRANSSAPVIFGPFSASMSFSEKDIRKAFALKLPKPLVSFALFSACASSPQLNVLRDVAQVDDDLRHCAINYISHISYVDDKSKTVWLPDLLRFYWKDFGGNRLKVLQNVARLSSKPLRQKIEDILEASGPYGKPKVNFVAFEWTEMIVL